MKGYFPSPPLLRVAYAGVSIPFGMFKVCKQGMVVRVHRFVLSVDIVVMEERHKAYCQ